MTGRILKTGDGSRPDRITVLVSEPDPVARVGLRTILEAGVGVSVVGEAGDWRETEARVGALAPDVVLLHPPPDAGSPAEALQALRAVAHRPIRTVLIVDCGAQAVVDAIGAGAAGVVCRAGAVEHVLDVVRGAAGGLAIASDAGELLRAWIARVRPLPDDRSPVHDLSRRQRQILGLVAHGHADVAIARLLNISEPTVRSHVHHVLTRLNVANRVQAVAVAYRYGLVELEDP